MFQRLAFTFVLLLIAAAGPALAVGSWVYFPMIADGTAGGGYYKTHFSIHGHGMVYLTFLNPNGVYFDNLGLECVEQPGLNGTKSWVNFNLDDSNGVVTIYTTGEHDLKTGWAYLAAESALDMATCGYSYIKYGHYPQTLNSLLWEVTVPAAEAGTDFLLEATIGIESPILGGVDTGLAVANPNDVPIIISVALVVNGATQTRSINLPVQGQYAIYLSGLFSGVDFGDRYAGHVEILSNQNFFAMGMRSAQSSYEVCSYLPVQPYAPHPVGTWTEYEPNDTTSTANALQWITSGQHNYNLEINGTFNGVALDYYQINLAAGQKLDVLLTSLIMGSGSFAANKAVDLCSSDGSVYTCTHTNLPWDVKSLTYTCPADSYYWIRVVGDAYAPYKLYIHVTN